LGESIAGVVDAICNDQFPRGPGTVDVVITSTAGSPTQDLLDEVAAYIETKKPACSNVLLKGPVPVVTNFEIILYCPTTTGEDSFYISEGQAIVQAMFVRDPTRPEIKLQKIGGYFYKARLNAYLMDIKNVVNCEIVAPVDDIEVTTEQIVTLGTVNITVQRVTVI
jgi:uncharacterized phage protein gp47/JayE